MADVARYQHLFGALSWKMVFAEGKVSLFQGRIDADLVFVVLQPHPVVVAQAKSPVFRVVRGPVRNPVGMIRQREQMFFQLLERDLRLNRNTVTDHVQVRFLEIDDSLAE